MAKRVRITAEVTVGFPGGFREYRAGAVELVPEAHWRKIEAAGAGVIDDEQIPAPRANEAQNSRAAEGDQGGSAEKP